MSDFGVGTGGMSMRRLSDSDAEALIAGGRVDGVPAALDAMLSTMRERAESVQGIPISGALSEFIIKGNLSAIAAGAGTFRASPGRFGPTAKRAAAAFAIVPAKILIGASIAAAAVGGAQAFSIVDVPLLPDPGPQVVTSVPVVTVPAETSDEPATTVATTATSVLPSTQATETDTTAATAVPASAQATETDTTTPVRPPMNQDAVSSRPTLPTQAAVEGIPGCEFGQNTSARPDSPGHAEAPSLDPCAAGTPGGIDNGPPVLVEPTGGVGAPASIPASNGASPPAGAPGQSAGDNSGNGAGNSNGAAPAPAPNSGQGGNAGADDVGLGNASTDPPRSSGQGRTPPGD
jgi:hypothetical protein